MELPLYFWAKMAAFVGVTAGPLLVVAAICEALSKPRNRWR